jgi:hypothetical protein
VYWRLGPWLQGNKGIKPSMVKKVAKVTHAIASEGTSKNWHFDFSDLAISIENSQNFTGWALVGPAIYMGFCWIPQFLPTIQSTINLKTEPLNYPTRIQRFEIAEIEFSLVFSTESNGSKWVERG